MRLCWKHPRARFTGARGGVLRHRAGAVYAFVLWRSPALSAGRTALAAGAFDRNQGDGQFRHFAGAHPAGLGAVVATARWRLVSRDGSTLDVADEKGNAAAFGRPGASRGTSAYPQVRLVSLAEIGTHVLFGTHTPTCCGA